MRVSELNELFLTGKNIKYKSDQIITYTNKILGDKIVWLYHGNVIASRNSGDKFFQIFQGWSILTVSTKRRLNNFKNIRLFHENFITFISYYPYDTFQYFDGSATIPNNWCK